MRVFDPKTGRSYFRKSRRRFDEPGHARSLVFSCYRRYQFLIRDRTRLWFIEELEAARRERSFDLCAYVSMPEEANPVRRGLVAKAEQWEWSSARWNAGIRPVRIEIDATLPSKHELVR
jgi:hypothetical protein